MDVQVLTAVVHGDAALFAERPELMDAKVWVHFHSSARKYNRVECWGPLGEATATGKRRRNLQLDLDGRLDQLQSAIATAANKRRTRRRSSSHQWQWETIFNALVALLLL